MKLVLVKAKHETSEAQNSWAQTCLNEKEARGKKEKKKKERGKEENKI